MDRQAMMRQMMARGGGGGRPGQSALEEVDDKWLAWIDKQNESRGFIAWTKFQHPQLGEVEIGGFRPYLRINPPADQIPELVEKHAQFVLYLASRFAEIAMEEPQVKRLSSRLFELKIKLRNWGDFPYATAMGQRSTNIPPIVLQMKLEDADTMKLFGGHTRIDMGNTSIRMHEIDHPELGRVLIDRDRTKLSGRVPPTWLLEELCHRNMAFCLLHAYEMPLPIIKKVESEKIDGNLHRVKVTLYNERLMPTISGTAAANRVQRPDILSLDGNVNVLAAGVDQKDLKNLKLASGIPGRNEVTYHFLVEGSGRTTVKLDCLKGGKHTKTLTLQ